MLSKRDAALAYASWGWHVMPVVPDGKVPATQHGVHDATTDPVRIRNWWTTNPEYNIGIAAGARSGIIVFDVDPRNGGESSWDDWTSQHGAVPDGPMQLTAGGGQHHIAQYDAEVRSCKLGAGIDLLADGRYFVAHPSSINGRTYEWEASSDPFDGVAPPAIPERWRSAYLAMRRQSKPTATQGGGLIQGSRNDGLTALGGAMRRYGMTEAEIGAALAIANETRCEIPLPASELSQIVRSVCRYEPVSDLAADVSLGSEAADALLESIGGGEQSGYYLTRATSFLSQPSPLSWAIKGWIPSDGVVMIYGESGIGKTFVALDIACSLASGLMWTGKRTKKGVVVYLAGEGHYGLRIRLASWAADKNCYELHNIFISNRAIDLDAPDAAAQIIRAVRDVTGEDVVGVVVDTTNNHMSGDENSAQDTRRLINACQTVGRALGCVVMLIHHTGLAETARDRARGSSAWKASADVMILVTRAGDDGIEIRCTKAKDFEAPQPIYGRLERVELGWVDEDGEAISGAVFKPLDGPPVQDSTAPRRDSAITAHRRVFEGAWWSSGAEVLDGAPYVTKSAMIDYITGHMGMSESTAQTYVKPGRHGKPIADLLTAQVIKAHQSGWIVICEVTAAALLIQKG